ncbi:HNH endonuclease [Streptomyces melanosporofaciens]|uniref:HNH endonuclease n=1 Tax=Streptomyces melanosporofaciens TaxID=67327 RepID=UPI001FCC6A17|nr:HNH endonuclease [Streptomyces melanosporofaciens]
MHHLTYRSLGGSHRLSNLEVVHTLCHQQLHAGDRKKNTKSERPEARLSRVR